jgi:hypothetical protein
MTNMHSAQGPIPTNICQTSYEAGIEYHKIAAALQAKGIVAGEDPRLRHELCDPGAKVSESRSAFLAEVKHYHERTHQMLDHNGVAAAAKGHLAMQKKLICAVERGGDHSGIEAAALAISLESVGVDLLAAGHPTRATRPLFRIAARTTDRVILRDRHAHYKGLISDLAIERDMSPSQVAAGLGRSGDIDQSDPRLSIPADNLRNYNMYHMNEFVGHLKSTLYAHVPNLGPSEIPAYSRASILRDIAQLPKREEASETDLQKNSRYAAFMGSVARICEGAAMNLHMTDASSAKQVVPSLLATSVSAVQRGQAYAEWVRENGEVSLAKSYARASSQQEM